MPETRVKPRAKPQRAVPPPALLLIQGERLILPYGSAPQRAWPELAFAMLTEPEPDELSVWIQRLEDNLGVTKEHRATISARAGAVQESREEKRRRLLEQSARAAQARAPMRDPVFVRLISIKRRAAAIHLARADRLRVEDAKKNRKLIRRLERKADKLDKAAQDARTRELEQDRLFGEARDPILRARARGEDVRAAEVETAEVARDEHGARILHKRGTKKGMPVLVYDRGLRAKKLVGIEHAYVSGYLDGARGAGHPEQLKATAEQYGEAYEIDEGERSSRGEEGGGGGFGPKGPQLRAVEAGETLAVMRAGMSRRERRVLDLVCGQHMRVREAATVMGAGFQATIRALRAGLKLAGENWRRAQERRRLAVEEGVAEPTAAQRAKAAHQMISRMRTG